MPDRLLNQKEFEAFLKANKTTFAKDTGDNVLKVFFEGSKSCYTKGTVKTRNLLREWM